MLEPGKPPLKVPADLQHHVLLQYDDPEGRHPWLHWKAWLEIEGLVIENAGLTEWPVLVYLRIMYAIRSYYEWSVASNEHQHA